MYIISLLLTILSLSLFIKNMGGNAMSLPFNMLFICSTGIVLCSLAFVAYKKNINKNKNLLILLGLLLIGIRWACNLQFNEGVLVLLMVGILWLWIQQTYISEHIKRKTIYGIYFLSLTQCIVAALQFFYPQFALKIYDFDWVANHGRVYGIFQQVNLLASFLATGLGCGFICYLYKTSITHKILILAGIGLLSFWIVFSQSRAGEVGAICIILAIVSFNLHSFPKACLIAIATIAICAFAAWYVTHFVHFTVFGKEYLVSRAYDNSNFERWNIIKITMKMILLHPWLGYGYGNFEYAFSRFVLSHPELGYTYNNRITHPHNEILYQWFQGGIVSLSGVMIVIVGWVDLFINACRKNNYQMSMAMLALPLFIHANLEYPFYQSFVHLLVATLLLRLAIYDEPSVIQPTGKEFLLTRILPFCIGAVFIITGSVSLFVNSQLTKIERNSFVNFPEHVPFYYYVQYERLSFDEMVACLMQFNRTRDPVLLDVFMDKAKKWSQFHNDRNIMLNMIQIESSRGNTKSVSQLVKLYNKLFPLYPLMLSK